MPVLLGPFDPIKLNFEILNALLSQNLISYDKARLILKNSMGDNIPDPEKEKILDSLIKRT